MYSVNGKYPKEPMRRLNDHSSAHQMSGRSATLAFVNSLIRLCNTADLLLEAAEMLPILSLTLECGKALLQAKMFDAIVDFYEHPPQQFRQDGPIRAMRAQAAIELDNKRDISRSWRNVKGRYY
jgi:hypothetical protein